MIAGNEGTRAKAPVNAGTLGLSSQFPLRIRFLHVSTLIFTSRPAKYIKGPSLFISPTVWL